MLSLGVLQAVFVLLDLNVKVLSCKELHEHTENNLLVNLTRNSSNSSLAIGKQLSMSNTQFCL